MNDKRAVVKVHINGHHRKVETIGERVTFKKYPQFEFVLHKSIVDFDHENEKIIFSKKRWQATETRTGTRILWNFTSKISLIKELKEFIEKETPTGIEQQIMRKLEKQNRKLDVEDYVQLSMEDAGLKASPVQTLYFINCLKERGYKLEKYEG